MDDEYAVFAQTRTKEAVSDENTASLLPRWESGVCAWAQAPSMACAALRMTSNTKPG